MSKKKNVIYILVDGLYYGYIGSNDKRKSATPFIDKLMNNSIYLTDIYSSAPYTEGALVELFGGYQTLSHEGFLHNLKHSPKTFMEVLKSNGYQTASVLFNYVCGNSFHRGVDYPINAVLPYAYPLWSIRGEYYKELLDKNDITKKDYDDYSLMFDSFFELSMNLITELKEIDLKNKSIFEIISCEYVVKEYLPIIEEENKCYLKNKQLYMDNFLKAEGEHILISAGSKAQLKDNEELLNIQNKIFDEYKDLINEICSIQRKCNFNLREFGLALSKAIIKSMSDLYIKKKDIHNKKNIIDLLYNNYTELSLYTDLTPKNIFSKISVLNKKQTICFQRQLDDFHFWRTEIRDKNKPFFYFLHPDDIHVDPIPFSYSVNDFDLVKSEFEQMSDFVKELNGEYNGNLMYGLGLRRIDNKIKELYTLLEKEGVLEDTIIIINSDHGFYHSYKSYRNNSIENYYEENFHIPFILFDKEYNYKREIKGLYAQRDIPYTLLNYLNISIPESFVGIDFLKEKPRDYNLIEYPGRGCPDIYRRDIMLAAFDQNYKVCVRIFLQDDISKVVPIQIFDLIKDPSETRNLANKKYDHDKVEILMSYIIERIIELKKDYNMI